MFLLLFRSKVVIFSDHGCISKVVFPVVCTFANRTIVYKYLAGTQSRKHISG